MALPSWVPSTRTAEISETEAQAAFSGMQTVELTLPTAVASGPVVTRYLKTAVEPSPEEEPPLLLVHGFDISSVEYRRLLPLLEALGIEAYAPCIAGWGFTETTNLRSVRVEAKRAHLLAFWRSVLGSRPTVWVGASLGACVALDCYRAEPGAFRSFASLAPAFFTPPPPILPAPLGRLLLQNVLTAPRVRESIAKQAYHVKEDQTEDAIRCGNLHLSRAKWEDDSLEWLMSCAYGNLAPHVAELGALEALTLWGREDEVIPPAGVGSWPAARLVQALGSRGTFRWVERSGHTPHCEAPEVTAQALAAFARGEAVDGDGDTSSVVAAAERWDAVAAAVERLGGAASEWLGRLE